MNSSNNINYSPQGKSKGSDSTKTQTLTSVIDDLIIRFIMNCPDEVFESFNRLFFQIEEAHWFYEDFYREHNSELPSLSFKQFVDEIFKQCPALQPYRDAIDKHTQSFYEYKNTVPVFGAIILNQARDKVLLVKGWNSRSWSFPRGKVNQDETETTCAAREVKEEIGFDISPYLNPKHYLKMQFNEQVVTLYIVSGVPENTKFHPETRKEVSAIEWHSLDEIVHSRSPANPKKCSNKYWIISSFIPRLKKWLAKNQKSMDAASIKSSPSAAAHHHHQMMNSSSKRKLSPKSAEHSPSTEMDKKRGRRGNGRKSPQTVTSSTNHNQNNQGNNKVANARKLSFDNQQNEKVTVASTNNTTTPSIQQAQPQQQQQQPQQPSITIMRRETPATTARVVPAATPIMSTLAPTAAPLPYNHHLSPLPSFHHSVPPPQYGMYSYAHHPPSPPFMTPMYNPYVHAPYPYTYGSAPHPTMVSTPSHQVIV